MTSTVGMRQLPWYETILVSIWTIMFGVFGAVLVGFLIGTAAGQRYFPFKRLLKRFQKMDIPLLPVEGEDDYSEEDYKMVLVVRMDLEMTKGKAAAQCCHACLSAYKETLRIKPERVKIWEINGQPKITLKCNSEEDLMRLYQDACRKGLVARYIQDAGRTQIAPGSLTVLAIGPDLSDKINDVTGQLKLY